jgi:hypothetical protein
VKAWQWYTGQVNTNRDDFLNFYKDEANKNKCWTPTSESTQETKAPYLLAIPNAMVAILRELGGAATPANVLNAVDEPQQVTEGAIPDDQWKTVIDWCILAGQANSNGAGKSLLAIEVDSVAIDDNEFDTWVGSKLDVAFELTRQQTPSKWQLNPNHHSRTTYKCLASWHPRSGKG